MPESDIAPRELDTTQRMPYIMDGGEELFRLNEDLERGMGEIRKERYIKLRDGEGMGEGEIAFFI